MAHLYFPNSVLFVAGASSALRALELLCEQLKVRGNHLSAPDFFHPQTALSHCLCSVMAACHKTFIRKYCCEP